MATTSTAVAAIEPMFTQPERLALAGFLAGYTGLTREAYALDLRQYASWCRQWHLSLFQARRADIECFAREMEARGRARATITRRLCTIAGFYRYAVEEELLEHSPAAHVRRPRLDYESHATGLDRNELGALLPSSEGDLMVRPLLLGLHAHVRPAGVVGVSAWMSLAARIVLCQRTRAIANVSGPSAGFCIRMGKERVRDACCPMVHHDDRRGRNGPGSTCRGRESGDGNA